MDCLEEINNQILLAVQKGHTQDILRLLAENDDIETRDDKGI